MIRLRERLRLLVAVLLLGLLACGTWFIMRGSSLQARLSEIAVQQESLRAEMSGIRDLACAGFAASDSNVEQLHRQLGSLESQLRDVAEENVLLRAELATRCVGQQFTGVRICSIRVHEALDLVYGKLDVLSDAVSEKQDALVELYESRVQSGVTGSAFDLAALRLRIELLMARTDLTVGLIYQMEVSASFTGQRATLTPLKREGGALSSAVRELIDTINVSTMTTAEHQAAYSFLQTLCDKLEAQATEVLRARILEMAVQQAQEMGMDFLIYEDGIVAVKAPAENEDVLDLNGLLEEDLQSLL